MGGKQENCIENVTISLLLSCALLLHETVLNVNKTVYFHCLSGKATTGKF